MSFSVARIGSDSGVAISKTKHELEAVRQAALFDQRIGIFDMQPVPPPG
jgi:hypothetical protein